MGICMIGHFAFNSSINDGQTVKTNEIYNELIRQNYEVDVLDTFNYKKNIISFFFKVLCKFIKNDIVILVLAGGGAKTLIPLLSKLNFLRKKRICYCCIGSWLDNTIEHSKRLSKAIFKIDKILNDDRNMKYFDDKVLFNRKFKDFVKRDWIYLPDSNYDEFRNIVIKHETVMVKPIDMSSGKGIETYTYIDDERLREFYESIKNRNLLIEEKVTNHKEISVLNPSCANTIRVYTIVGKDGCVSIISAIIRIGSSGSCVDNYHSGGVASAIDINTGIIYTVPVDVNGRRHILHPSTHKEIIGKKIPKWDELIKNVTAAAKIFPTSRYIGWDICITDYGIEFIEGNYHSDPGLLQSADQVGKYYIVKNLI